MLEGLIPDWVGVVIFLLIALISFPQAWREENSWWFAIIKFWFFLLPLMLSAFGVLAFFAGPIYAIGGIFYMEALPVTILYAYTGLALFVVHKINQKYNNMLEKL